MKKQYFFFLLFFIVSSVFGQTGLTIATWNIEHLGSGGRGFPELVGNDALGNRTEEDFKKIASFIKDTLSLEIICVQEIASSKKESGKSYSNELDKITTNLGNDWKYYLANFEGGSSSENEMQNAFVYDQAKVDLKVVFEMEVPNYCIGEKKAFDRKPLIGYFVPKGSQDGFVIINLHLSSGQDNYENHLASMIMVEQNLTGQLKKYGIENEEDIIILGDFNDNPFKNSDLIIDYLEEKKYTHMVNKNFGSTRMDTNLKSIIDHIFLSKSAKKHVIQSKANIFKPKDMDKDGLKRWRTVYSDHFPLYIEYK